MRGFRDGCCQKEICQKAYEVAQAMELAAKTAEQLSASASVDVKPKTPPVVVQNVKTARNPLCQAVIDATFHAKRPCSIKLPF